MLHECKIQGTQIFTSTVDPIFLQQLPVVPFPFFLSALLLALSSFLVALRLFPVSPPFHEYTHLPHQQEVAVVCYRKFMKAIAQAASFLLSTS